MWETADAQGCSDQPMECSCCRGGEPLSFDGIYLVAFILCLYITFLFEQLLDTIKRKEEMFLDFSACLRGKGSAQQFFLCCSELI